MGKKLGRNSPCPCGSGKKLKKCCVTELEASMPGPGPVSKETMAETDRWMAEEGYTHEVALQLQELAARRRRRRKRGSVIPAAIIGAMLGGHV